MIVGERCTRKEIPLLLWPGDDCILGRRRGRRRDQPISSGSSPLRQDAPILRRTQTSALQSGAMDAEEDSRAGNIWIQMRDERVVVHDSAANTDHHYSSVRVDQRCV